LRHRNLTHVAALWSTGTPVLRLTDLDLAIPLRHVRSDGLRTPSGACHTTALLTSIPSGHDDGSSEWDHPTSAFCEENCNPLELKESVETHTWHLLQYLQDLPGRDCSVSLDRVFNERWDRRLWYVTRELVPVGYLTSRHNRWLVHSALIMQDSEWLPSCHAETGCSNL
jgi:hypothetical protein